MDHHFISACPLLKYMKKNKIFIIEDDRSLVKIITEALDPEKFEVSLALQSPRTLKRIGNLKPNLIVLDILLPGQSGFEFLAKLKNYKPTKAIPVLILSNLGQTAEIKRALD